MTMIKVGQIYASNRKADIASGIRQHRRVRSVHLGFVFLVSEPTGPITQVRFRDDIGSQSIPGYRLVRDVES